MNLTYAPTINRGVFRLFESIAKFQRSFYSKEFNRAQIRYGISLIAAISFSAPAVVLAQTSSSVDAFRANIGSQWSAVRTENVNSNLVLRELVRPYPESGVQAMKASSLVGMPTSPESVAASFLMNYGRQFVTPLDASASPTNLLVVKKVISTKNKSEYQSRGTDFTIVYGQIHQNIPVFESSLTIKITQDGGVWSVSSKLAPVDADILMNPNLSAADALSRARATLGDPNAIPEADASLYIFAPTHLAWRLNFPNPHFKEMMIDAISGEVLMQRKNVRD